MSWTEDIGFERLHFENCQAANVLKDPSFIHESSDWQVLLDDELIWESLEDTINLTRIDICNCLIVGDARYTFRVRYRSSAGDVSPWSDTQVVTQSIYPDLSRLRIGDPYGGGYIAGVSGERGRYYVLVVSPAEEGEIEDIQWKTMETFTDGTSSTFDGTTNTEQAVVQSTDPLDCYFEYTKGKNELLEHPAAMWVADLRIAGHDDWVLPSIDDMQVLCNNLKPNSHPNRVGVSQIHCGPEGKNEYTAPPLAGNERNVPSKTEQRFFSEGEQEAFDPDALYWTSTQQHGTMAWSYDFNTCSPVPVSKKTKAKARAIRRVPICDWYSKLSSVDRLQPIPKIIIEGAPDQVGETPVIALPAGMDCDAVDWQIYDRLGDLVWESWNDATNTRSISIPPDFLHKGDQYKLQTRCRSNEGLAGEWIDTVFVVDEAPAVPPFGVGIITDNLAEPLIEVDFTKYLGEGILGEMSCGEIDELLDTELRGINIQVADGSFIVWSSIDELSYANNSLPEFNCGKAIIPMLGGLLQSGIDYEVRVSAVLATGKLPWMGETARIADVEFTGTPTGTISTGEPLGAIRTLEICLGMSQAEFNSGYLHQVMAEWELLDSSGNVIYTYRGYQNHAPCLPPCLLAHNREYTLRSKYIGDPTLPSSGAGMSSWDETTAGMFDSAWRSQTLRTVIPHLDVPGLRITSPMEGPSSHAPCRVSLPVPLTVSAEVTPLSTNFYDETRGYTTSWELWQVVRAADRFVLQGTQPLWRANAEANQLTVDVPEGLIQLNRDYLLSVVHHFNYCVSYSTLGHPRNYLLYSANLHQGACEHQANIKHIQEIRGYYPKIEAPVLTKVFDETTVNGTACGHIDLSALCFHVANPWTLLDASGETPANPQVLWEASNGTTWLGGRNLCTNESPSNSVPFVLQYDVPYSFTARYRGTSGALSPVSNTITITIPSPPPPPETGIRVNGYTGGDLSYLTWVDGLTTTTVPYSAPGQRVTLTLLDGTTIIKTEDAASMSLPSDLELLKTYRVNARWETCYGVWTSTLTFRKLPPPPPNPVVTHTKTFDRSGCYDGTTPAFNATPTGLREVNRVRWEVLDGSTVVLSRTSTSQSAMYDWQLSSPNWNSLNWQRNYIVRATYESDFYVVSGSTSLVKCVPQYTVTFRNWNATTLKTEVVNHGGSATPPPNPTRPGGYTFAGWSGTWTNVTSNRTVTATYTAPPTPPTPPSGDVPPPSGMKTSVTYWGNLPVPVALGGSLAVLEGKVTVSNGAAWINANLSGTGSNGVIWWFHQGGSDLHVPAGTTMTAEIYRSWDQNGKKSASASYGQQRVVKY